MVYVSISTFTIMVGWVVICASSLASGVVSSSVVICVARLRFVVVVSLIVDSGFRMESWIF